MRFIRKNEYPAKTTVNLVVREKTWGSPSRAIPLFVLFMLFLAGFVKFGVVDALARMNAAQNSLGQISAELSGYIEYNEDYNEVKEQYSRHFSDYLNEEEVMLQNRVKVLKMLEEDVMNRADVVSISIRDNTCRVVINRVTLDIVSDIVADLEENPLVQYITVSTASTQQADDEDEESGAPQRVTADMTITLTGGNVNVE